MIIVRENPANPVVSRTILNNNAMILEWKIFLNQFSQKTLLIRGASLLFLLYLMNRQPAYAPPVISMLICFAASFSSLEYTINVFGLDGYAFYLHHMAPTPLWVRLLRRVSVGVMIQLLYATALSAYFFFKTDPAHFRFHLLILSIVLLQNFATGCLFSAAFPRAIPKTIEKKMFRANPGLGLSLSGGLNMFGLAGFYVFVFLARPSTVLLYSGIYLVLLLAFAPVSAIWAARIVRNGIFEKLQALTTEQ